MAGITINSAPGAAQIIDGLSASSKRLTSTFDRLSSGQRINKASDDAAGLAISSDLAVNSRILSQGVRNISDAQSVLSIADSALGELSNIVIRMTELAEQAVNGTLSNVQRKALDLEAQSLSNEYLRISRATTFNGIGLFDGSMANGLKVQMGFSSATATLGGQLANGTFSAMTTVAPSNAITSQQLIDVNGDGVLDNITVGALSSSVRVNIGNGDGTFSLGSYFNIGSATSVATGDFNGDGIVDFITGGNTTVTAFQNNGDGTFSISATFSAGSTVTAVTLADLDGDGKDDLAYSDSGNHIVTASSMGNGTFAAPVTYAMSKNVYAFTAGDVNGDGRTDLAIAYGAYPSSAPSVAVLIANGNGSLKAPTIISTAPASYAGGPKSVKMGDINNDGILDIVSIATQASSASGYSYYVSLGNGNGSFSAAVSRVDDYITSSGSEIEIGDLNGDGNLDLVVSHAAALLTRVMFGNGNGTFTMGPTIAVGGAIAVGDISGDGAADFMIGNRAALAQTISGVNALADFSLATKVGARQALPYFQKTLERISSQRATVGAFSSRTDMALSSLKVSAEQYKEAASRIVDADTAEEVAELTRLKILQQMGVAVLAQHEKSQDIVLNLIQASGGA